MILGLDTSTSAITVAVGRLHDDGDVTIQDRRSIIDARAHTEHLAPLIAASLSAVDARPADLRHIVVGTGPGPFTGLRVGLVTAVTMGAALG
nr:tRNA (adenosine(37)-N6)-threonylcarbamoyltransferase complex dimerization subunit type 1 TsaB [Phycicoccus sp.]